MRTVNYDMRALLRLAKDGAFTIPVFQRDFVWREAQVKLLIDSVSRNFPIGSLLVLAERRGDGALREDGRRLPVLAARPIEAAIRSWALDDHPSPDLIAGHDGGGADRYYVLDGQQRLTSLVRVFLDASEQKSYYVDLKRLVEQFKRNGQWMRESSDLPWVRALKRRDPNPERREKNRYLRADVILQDPTKCQIFVGEYFSDLPEYADRTAALRAAAEVNNIFETMRNYQVPVVVIDPDSPVEAICRIFETINSTGTRLTTFDLAVARFFQKGTDLRDRWNDAKKRAPTVVNFDVDGERVLQVLALWKGIEDREKNEKQGIEATRTAILNLDEAFLIANWDRAVDHLEAAYRWTVTQGATPQTAPNEATVVAIAAFFGIIDRDWKQSNPAWGALLEKWYFAKLLQQGARQATNYRLGVDIDALLRWARAGKVPDCPPVFLSEQHLVELNRSDVRYRALQALLAKSARHDIRSAVALEPGQVEDHHIFPESLRKSEGVPRRSLDSICNRMYVARDTNRHLSDRLPEDYLGELAREAKKFGVESKVDQRLAEAALPGSVTDPGFASRYAVANFEQFLLDRAKLIRERVKDVIGDALSGSPVIEVGSDEPADLAEDD